MRASLSAPAGAPALLQPVLPETSRAEGSSRCREGSHYRTFFRPFLRSVRLLRWTRLCAAKSLATFQYSTIITTNLVHGEWPNFLDNRAMVEALFSRLRHYCQTVHIDGPSLRVLYTTTGKEDRYESARVLTGCGDHLSPDC